MGAVVPEIEEGPQVPTDTNDNEGANGAFLFPGGRVGKDCWC